MINIAGRNQEKFKTGVLEILQEQFPEKFNQQPTVDQMEGTLASYLQFDWLADHGFDEREINEIKFAHIYTTFFGHGTSGHNAYVIMSKLTDTLLSMQQSIEDHFNGLP